MLSTRMSSITTILLVVMACGSLLLFSQPTATFASRVEVRASGYELRVIEHTSGGMENMAPGDVEEKMVTVANEGEEAFNVTVSVKQLANAGGNGEYRKSGETANPLFEFLKVAILKGDNQLWKGKMAEAKGLNLGTFAPGESRDYTIRVEFPLEAGNEFQNERVTIKWIFRATWPQGPGTDPGEEPGDDPSDDPTPPPADAEEPSETAADEALPIDGEEIPAGMVEVEKEEEEPIAIEEEEIPGGPGEIPRTGEEIPFLSYGLGLALLAGGLALVRRRA